MEISILGTPYTIARKKYEDDLDFCRLKIDGYCDSRLKHIVYGDMLTFPGWEHESAEFAAAYEKEILRHEIVHAFMNESGLQSSALEVEGAWSKNEEMIDWFAIQGPKIYAVWQEAGCV